MLLKRKEKQTSEQGAPMLQVSVWGDDNERHDVETTFVYTAEFEATSEDGDNMLVVHFNSVDMLSAYALDDLFKKDFANGSKWGDFADDMKCYRGLIVDSRAWIDPKLHKVYMITIKDEDPSTLTSGAHKMDLLWSYLERRQKFGNILVG